MSRLYDAILFTIAKVKAMVEIVSEGFKPYYIFTGTDSYPSQPIKLAGLFH